MAPRCLMCLLSTKTVALHKWRRTPPPGLIQPWRLRLIVSCSLVQVVGGRERDRGKPLVIGGGHDDVGVIVVVSVPLSEALSMPPLALILTSLFGRKSYFPFWMAAVCRHHSLPGGVVWVTRKRGWCCSALLGTDGGGGMFIVLHFLLSVLILWWRSSACFWICGWTMAGSVVVEGLQLWLVLWFLLPGQLC